MSRNIHNAQRSTDSNKHSKECTVRSEGNQIITYDTKYITPQSISHTCTNTHFYPSIVLSEWRQYSLDICSVCRERKDDLTDAVIPHTQRATLSDEKKTGKKEGQCPEGEDAEKTRARNPKGTSQEAEWQRDKCWKCEHLLVCSAD